MDIVVRWIAVLNLGIHFFQFFEMVQDCWQSFSDCSKLLTILILWKSSICMNRSIWMQMDIPRVCSNHVQQFRFVEIFAASGLQSIVSLIKIIINDESQHGWLGFESSQHPSHPHPLPQSCPNLSLKPRWSLLCQSREWHWQEQKAILLCQLRLLSYEVAENCQKITAKICVARPLSIEAHWLAKVPGRETMCDFGELYSTVILPFHWQRASWCKRPRTLFPAIQWIHMSGHVMK